MYAYFEIPQSIQTLADARPGDRVVVHSVLFPNWPRGKVVYPDAGEALLCKEVRRDGMEFERADGSRLSIQHRNANRVRVEQFRAADEQQWYGR
ncbi:MAG: hypothetical protein ACYC28_03240 [Longimicrobiales bacterium]